MKIKIGNKIYDGNNEPVMIIISEKEKRQIVSMPSGKTKFCSYPDLKELKENNYKKIKEWMKT